MLRRAGWRPIGRGHFHLAAGNTNPQGIADPPPLGALAVDAVLQEEGETDVEHLLAALPRASAQGHAAALLSIMAEFEQTWGRPKRRLILI